MREQYGTEPRQRATPPDCEGIGDQARDRVETLDRIWVRAKPEGDLASRSHTAGHPEGVMVGGLGEGRELAHGPAEDRDRVARAGDVRSRQRELAGSWRRAGSPRGTGARNARASGRRSQASFRVAGLVRAPGFRR